MCKLHILDNATFIVYRIENENYVGVTSDLKRRMNKHRSKNKFDVSKVTILNETKDLNEALSLEVHYQKIYNCTKGIRNQEGSKNPYAKTVLHTITGVYYDTIKEACNALGFSYSAARHQLLKPNNKYNLLKFN